MIRCLKPKNIIEIGSGFSSAAMLDINEKLFNNKINITFIEPYPDVLNSLLKKTDKINLIKSKLQNIDLKLFKILKENDILFIDSTHVSKFNSDVNYIFFNLLPVLNKNVFIHFHDIFYPFEYPKSWLEIGLAWNEAYILRAFLQYNNAFKIIFFNNYLWNFYKSLVSKKIPLFSKNSGGAIWIKKIK